MKPFDAAVLRKLVSGSALCLQLAALSGCSGDGADQGKSSAAESCTPDDADGVVGGKYTFDVMVDDDGFSPMILKAQNTANVTVNVRDVGTSPHGFSVGCIVTPNDTDCPTKSCFPDAATVAPLDPGSDAKLKFTVPLVEGIYPITSTADGDTQKAQFVVQ
jgi:hypothetical protein